MPTENQKIMDVIIPVFRPDETFLRLLQMLSRQTISIGKLILINTEREYWSDAAEALCRKLSAEQNAIGGIILRHISREMFDHAATRRLGIELSDAPVFVCMTDDAVPADGRLLEHLYDALMRRNAEKVAEAYACQLAREDVRPAEQFTRSFNYPEKSFLKGAEDLERLGIKTFFASNVCCAYRREIYDRLGGFCAHAIFNEDMIYASEVIRAGFKIAYCAEAKVIHSHNYTSMQQLHRNFDLGMSQAMHPEVFAGLPSEGEGVRLVRNTAGWLVKNGHALQLPGLFVQSACKYAGYRLGKSYRKLPAALCMKLAMNRGYLEKHRAELWGDIRGEEEKKQR